MATSNSKLLHLTDQSTKAEIMDFLHTCQMAAGDSMLDQLFSTQFIALCEARIDSDQSLNFIPVEPTVAPKSTRNLPNKWGIHTEDGTVLATGYMKSYLQSRARIGEFSYNRNENMAYFMSDEFLSQFDGGLIGTVAKAVRESERWIDPAAPKPEVPVAPAVETPANAPEPATPAEPPAETSVETPVETSAE